MLRKLNWERKLELYINTQNISIDLPSEQTYSILGSYNSENDLKWRVCHSLHKLVFIYDSIVTVTIITSENTHLFDN